ncbi:Tfp type 4 fimbrial pilin like signal peptide protein domain protein [Legionella geestiana]|uniref:Tfp type 4 fimbrial pilin like signal peptide protein domain protein n=1 Tax=Legionella geestiana TaxID=45065 RepID=A0A0W0TNJ8_9GAMM|nr:prepilin-type N-terminal cleavage/methylation domain-containing protein [Legionella geestiana]KTC97085.1 Tfp type 4 fimbrial pilin like signal peptide protein domain protein [Legionella geestiana]QBS11442.1 prepilin-type N-terminal cleavage/methylation domain-containing protein [Legionella geestiana]STX53898.1 Tfp type 4 fimbrial pilin like signal peptide protein domain protein [Legionella geestiana]
MRACRGLSLIELVCVLAVVALISLFAFPAFMPLTAQTRLTLRVNALTSAVALGKNLAITHGETYALLALTKNADWSKGFTLVRGSSLTEGEPVRRWTFAVNEADIRWQGMQSKNALIFNAHFNQNICNGRFVLKAAGHTRTLIVNRFCRMRLQKNDYTEPKGS